MADDDDDADESETRIISAFPSNIIVSKIVSISCTESVTLLMPRSQMYFHTSSDDAYERFRRTNGSRFIDCPPSDFCSRNLKHCWLRISTNSDSKSWSLYHAPPVTEESGSNPY